MATGAVIVIVARTVLALKSKSSLCAHTQTIVMPGESMIILAAAGGILAGISK